MKKTFFASREIKKEEYNTEYDFSLHYHLLTTRIRDLNKDKYTQCYGIEVTKTYMDCFGNEITQKSTADNITTDKKEIFSLLKIVYEQKITPVCLCEVIDDITEDNDIKFMEA